MKRLLTLLVLMLVCGRLIIAQRAQPLLGVGQNPTTPNTPGNPNVPASLDGLFDDQGPLQEIYIEINAKDWQALKDNYLANTYYPADFKWNGQIVRNVGVRSRGTASRSPTKPALRIDFDRYTSGQKFFGLKSLIVKNNVTDASLLHERLAMKLFARMGFPTPREASIRLILNGVYDGVYSVVESPDKDYVKRIYGENDGWLYKFDRNVGDDPYYFGYLGDDPAQYVPHHWQPQTHESDPQPGPIIEMIRRINQSGDADFKPQVDPYLSVDQFTREAAIENFLAEVDGLLGESGMNNFYVYRAPNSTLHNFLPWDKSETFRSGDTFSVVHNIEDVPGSIKNQMMEHVWKSKTLQQLYFDTLSQCADIVSETVAGDARGWLERELDREYAQIKDHAIADPKKPFTNDQFTAAIEQIRTFARQRPGFVRGEVATRRPQ